MSEKDKKRSYRSDHYHSDFNASSPRCKVCGKKVVMSPTIKNPLDICIDCFEKNKN